MQIIAITITITPRHRFFTFLEPRFLPPPVSIVYEDPPRIWILIREKAEEVENIQSKVFIKHNYTSKALILTNYA